jgi:glucose-6-phosphate dehydrogenase assembly protein OpcA
VAPDLSQGRDGTGGQSAGARYDEPGKGTTSEVAPQSPAVVEGEDPNSPVDAVADARPMDDTLAGTGETIGSREFGEIIAVGVRPSGGGRITLADPPKPGEPTLRWLSRAQSIEEIERELARIWCEPDLTIDIEGVRTRHVAARTSVMNLVVIARQAEVGQRAADTISRLSVRHPSRTLVVTAADPDGPPWLDARIQAHCVLPRADAPETCAELIYLTAGGETGRHLAALVAPLLIHDLPVTVWWPGEPQLPSTQAHALLAVTDRLVVDGSAWTGDGLARLGELATAYERFPRLSIRDFALVRQSRWREAIASVFDLPEFLPFLPHLRRIAVTYATRDESGDPGTTNIVKPVYHVAWLAARLGLEVRRPLATSEVRGQRTRAPRPRPGDLPPLHRGLVATLRDRHADVAVVLRPVRSAMPGGTTLRVELLAEHRGSELRADVTAEAENVHVRVWLDGVEALVRTFKAPRRSDVDLLGEAIEVGGRDPLSMDTIAMAAVLTGGHGPNVAARDGPPAPPPNT